MVDFGWVSTSGGLRLFQGDHGLVAVPLPMAGSFDIRIKAKGLPNRWKKPRVRAVKARDRKGRVGETVDFAVENEEVFWRHDGTAFSYLLDVTP